MRAALSSQPRSSKRCDLKDLASSALSVNIAGLEGQDEALTRAVAEGLYVVCIIGWYLASKNANRNTNANVTSIVKFAAYFDARI
jgi:hypothetical protein